MNNNITEDYCSFEVSKLLKEKEFGIPVFRYFRIVGGEAFDADRRKPVNWNDDIKMETAGGMTYISNPTHALAIKWLRENFGVHINPTKPFHRNYWSIGKIPMESRVKGEENSDSWGRPISHGQLKGRFKTYEEAVEEALLHTLKILI